MESHELTPVPPRRHPTLESGQRDSGNLSTTIGKLRRQWWIPRGVIPLVERAYTGTSDDPSDAVDAALKAASKHYEGPNSQRFLNAYAHLSQRPKVALSPVFGIIISKDGQRRFEDARSIQVQANCVDLLDKDEEVLPDELNLATRLESLYSDLQRETTSFVTWYGPLCSRK